MRAAIFNRQVQFLRMQLQPDGFGFAEVWANAGSLKFADKKDISDGERWRAGEVQAHVTTRFTVRWGTLTASITPADRLVCEGREYDIFGIKEIVRNRLIEITAAARNDFHL